MASLNTKSAIIERNKEYFRNYLNINEETFFKKLAKAGKPNGYGDGKWSVSNPTAGRCGSVINALRLAGKIPDGFIPCGQNDKNGSHFYMINPDTSEVIDPTVYQMEEDYKYDQYHTRFLPQLSKNVKDVLAVLELEVDSNKFCLKRGQNGVEIILKKAK